MYHDVCGKLSVESTLLHSGSRSVIFIQQPITEVTAMDDKAQDPRLQFPGWAKTPSDRALFYVVTANKNGLPLDFDTMPDDVAKILFPVAD